LNGDTCLAKVRPRQRFEQGVRTLIHPLQDSPRLTVAPARKPLAKELNGHIPSPHSALNHDQGLSKRQATQSMDQDIGQGRNGTDCARRKQQSGVVDGLAADSLFPPVINMAGSRRRQAPEAVVWRSTGARQKLAVPQDGNQLRRRRRKRIQSTLRLQKPATDSPAKGRIIHTKSGEYGPAGGPATVL
jgi:hypothetical protein